MRPGTGKQRNAPNLQISRGPSSGPSSEMVMPPRPLRSSDRIRFWGRLAVRMTLLVLALSAAVVAGDWIEDRLVAGLRADADGLRVAIVLAVTLYVVLMALPFVPGVEIGLTLLAAFGPPIAPVVYAATVLALVLSFLLGRLVPLEAALRWLDALRLRRAAALLRQFDALAPDQRLGFLGRNASSRLGPLLLRHRHLALVAALNLPGNSLLGGGGGIGLAAGFSRLFGLADYTVAVAVAVAPVPLLVHFLGA